MRKILSALPALFLLAKVAAAQIGGDTCHVYVVDSDKMRRAFEKLSDPQALEKASLAAQTVFPEFRPARGEEELTTKTYPFPNSKLIITASVFYTDEMMASSQDNDSMLLGIVVARSAVRDATSVPDNAVAEVTSNEHTDAVRAKKFVKVSGRLYLVGIECRRKEKRPSE